MQILSIFQSDTHNPDASYDKIATLDDTPRVDVTARNGIEKTQTR
jgi:hypothetical protein